VRLYVRCKGALFQAAAFSVSSGGVTIARSNPKPLNYTESSFKTSVHYSQKSRDGGFQIKTCIRHTEKDHESGYLWVDHDDNKCAAVIGGFSITASQVTSRTPALSDVVIEVECISPDLAPIVVFIVSTKPNPPLTLGISELNQNTIKVGKYFFTIVTTGILTKMPPDTLMSFRRSRASYIRKGKTKPQEDFAFVPIDALSWDVVPFFVWRIIFDITHQLRFKVSWAFEKGDLDEANELLYICNSYFVSHQNGFLNIYRAYEDSLYKANIPDDLREILQEQLLAHYRVNEIPFLPFDLNNADQAASQ
jgi:hypothetical protein